MHVYSRRRHMADLTGRTAFVTGGSRGLGLAVAAGLRARGASVSILARNAEAVSAAVEELSALDGPGDLLAVVGDVADLNSVQEAVRAVGEWAGRLDILVNNAGPQLASAPLGPVDIATLSGALDTKLLGYLRVIQATLPILSEGGSGSIVKLLGATAHPNIPNAGVTGIVKAATAALTSYLAPAVADRNTPVNHARKSHGAG